MTKPDASPEVVDRLSPVIVRLRGSWVASMEADPEGDFVLRADYEALSADRDALQARLAPYEGSTGPVSVTGIVDDMAGTIKALANENARLRAVLAVLCDPEAGEIDRRNALRDAARQGGKP